jgi:hypothetical protein
LTHRPSLSKVEVVQGELPDPGPADPNALTEDSVTIVTFERAELEEMVRWVKRLRDSKKSPSVPRRVHTAVHAFTHLLNKYREEQFFELHAVNERYIGE